MLETYKILNGIDDVDYRTWFTKVDECHQRTRQAVNVSDDGMISGRLNLVPPKCRLEIRKNFFSCRVVKPWNDLPIHVKYADSVQDFKVKYDGYFVGT